MNGQIVSRVLLVPVVAILMAGSLIEPAEAQPYPGRNVNMVSGRGWPDGDPFQQRQNEPSMAASTRRPCTLLAGANDYRTVDVPGLPGGQVTGDAWLGVFKSFDCGRTWRSTLLPGYPQEPEGSPGRSSVLYGFAAGADPTIRAGTNGMFYYSGIVFDRDENGLGQVFVSRFIDNNNVELLSADPIEYLGAVTIDTGTSGQFLDKPWLATDIARPGSETCAIDTSNAETQYFEGGNVYIAYASFTGRGGSSKVNVSRSEDCGATFSRPIKISESDSVLQGTSIAIDPRNGDVFVAWRRIAAGNDPDAIMIAKSEDGGRRFTKPIEVSSPIFPFAQGTSTISFRTLAFPTMAIDGDGRVYVAWSERGPHPSGTTDARIVMATSDGVVTKGKMTWAAPVAVNDHGGRGHQIMPALAFAGGKLMLIYYDLREDHTVGRLTCPVGETCPDGVIEFVEERVLAGDLAEGAVDDVFDLQVADARPPTYTESLLRRHTIDVFATQADFGPLLDFGPAVRVSRYTFGTIPDTLLEPDQIIEQLKFNPPNLPIFRLGEAPFIGDYIDIAPAPTFLPEADGSWTFNTDFEGTVFHATWTDNRDVRPPPPGLGWSDYRPILLDGQTESIFDGGSVTACTPSGEGFSTAGMRNQNVYTSRLTQGLAAGAASNWKQLNIIRAFAAVVENTTDDLKGYLLTIVDDPDATVGSFLQLEDDDGAPQPPLRELALKLAPRSSISRTVFVRSVDLRARVRVDVEEVQLDEFGDFVLSGSGDVVPVPGGLRSSVVLNPDITNPDITNPDVEIFSPDITNPDITNPDITNPDITNPDITNPDITNIVVANPDITNPDITNPDITNPDITNPDITNPDITNPDITNGTLTDASWTVTNDGNTTATYNVNPLANGTLPEGAKLQLIAHTTYETPVVQDCELKSETQNLLVTNVASPDITNPDITNPDITNPDITNATVALAPGESVKVTMRIYVPDDPSGSAATAEGESGDSTFDFLQNHVSMSVLSHGDGSVVASLSISNEPLPDGVVGEPYLGTVKAVGGTGDLVWTIDPDPLGNGACTGLSHDAVDHELTLFGTPVSTGICEFTVTVEDSADPPHTATQTFTVLVRDLSISIEPEWDRNVVGDPHSLVVTVTADEGGGPVPVAGASPVVVVSPTPTSLEDYCASTDSAGQCTVVINSDQAGTFIANASVSVTFETLTGDLTIHRDTDPATPTPSGTNGSGPAEKEYFYPEGCSPGFWKNHLELWPSTGTDPNDSFNATFGTSFPGGDLTLEQAINKIGGGYDKLARHGTAALLNARSPDVSFELTEAEVVSMVQSGLADDATPGEPEASDLAVANTRGCPLS